MKKIFNVCRLSIVVIFGLFGAHTHAMEIEIDQPVLNVSLQDVIALTNKNNRTINNAQLRRKSEKFDLLVEKDKFRPDVFVSTSIGRESNLDKQKRVSRTQDTMNNYSVSTTVALKLKTGAELSLTWDGAQERQASSSRNDINGHGDDSKGNQYHQNTGFRINQPLSKGFGLNVNTGSIQIAELNENISQLTLKKTQINILTLAIISYRNLLYAQRQYEIIKKSLNISMKQYEFNKKLVEKGRMASLDLVQSENDVANKTIDLVLSENQLQQRKFDLIKILDVDADTSIVAIDELSMDHIPEEPLKLCPQNLIMIALLNSPDLLIAQAQQKISEINYLIASNNKQLDINFVAGYANNDEYDHLANFFSKSYKNKSASWDVGILFSHTFGDLSDDQAVNRSKVDLRIAKNNVINLKEDIRIEVKSRIREVNIRKKQIELSQKARSLSEKKLDIELKKLDMGRSSNFQIVSFQNDLVSAETSELLARIEYYNSITQLEKILGINRF
ncbi:MAG: TolC family protein [Candidatus Magnetomorum sp.]|nr:TolC family protein [Candidatus Magnetomorum sp.]